MAGCSYSGFLSFVGGFGLLVVGGMVLCLAVLVLRSGVALVFSLRCDTVFVVLMLGVLVTDGFSGFFVCCVTLGIGFLLFGDDMGFLLFAYGFWCWMGFGGFGGSCGFGGLFQGTLGLCCYVLLVVGGFSALVFWFCLVSRGFGGG